MITPAKSASISPGAVAEAIILPSAYSEPVFSSTIQLIAIRLKPNPTRDMMFPKKNNKNVLFLRSCDIEYYFRNEASNIVR